MLESPSQPTTTASTPTPLPIGVSPYAKRQQLLHALMSESELLLKNRLEVRHLMSRQPVTIPATMGVEEMIPLMRERRLHHLLVCGRGGELVGVVSDRDIHMVRGATAQQLMSFPPLTCTPETPVGAAITYLTNENISCLPVVENSRLVGVLTTTDLVLTLQCTLQLWLRLAQLIQHDPAWSKELDRIAGSLDGKLSAAELAARIKAARETIQREVRRLIDSVDFRTDLLTGLGNRRDLEEMLGLSLGIWKRHGRPFSLVVATIDHFARIRAGCGEAVVRPLLKAAARLVEESVGDGDFAARFREDAFAVLLPETRLDQAKKFCERLRDDARRHSQLGIELRIRVGAAEPAQGDDIASLLARAEDAVD